MNKLSLLLLSSISCSLVQAQTFDFDDVNDLGNNFNSLGGFSNVATGGLGTSGYVDVSSAGDNFTVLKNGVDATTFSGATVGGYFLYDGTGSISSRPMSFGFTSSGTDTYQGSKTTTGVDIKVNVSGAGSSAAIQLHNNGTQVGDNSGFTNLGTTAGWYYMELAIGGVSGGDFTGVTARLVASDNAGNLGTTLATLDNGGSGFTIASSLTSDTEVHGFFGGIGPSSRSIDGVDNFAVSVPEPSAYALIAGALALGWIMVRRRH